MQVPEKIKLKNTRIKISTHVIPSTVRVICFWLWRLFVDMCARLVDTFARICIQNYAGIYLNLLCCPGLQISNTCLNFNVARCSNLGTTSYHIQNSVSNSGGSGKHEFKWQSFPGISCDMFNWQIIFFCLNLYMWYTYIYSHPQIDGKVNHHLIWWWFTFPSIWGWLYIYI